MLVLTRSVDEAVIVGNNVRIVVVEIRQNKVKLGFEAPSNVAIDREEVRLSKIADRVRRERDA